MDNRKDAENERRGGGEGRKGRRKKNRERGKAEKRQKEKEDKREHPGQRSQAEERERKGRGMDGMGWDHYRSMSEQCVSNIFLANCPSLAASHPLSLVHKLDMTPIMQLPDTLQ